MLSLHMTGSPWYLLLLVPGMYILSRQYLKGPAPSAHSYSRYLLFGLQALALLILTVSLTAPELRRSQVEFSNPAVLIFRDQSASFRNGQYLGLGESYKRFENSLSEAYPAGKFNLGVIDFNESAWPVSGLIRPQTKTSFKPSDTDTVGLTSFSALAEFIDSAAIANLQAIFLFSDGRSNVDFGKGPRTWKAPIYPVVFSADSIREVQAERIDIALNSGDKSSEAQVRYRSVGNQSDTPTLAFIQSGKTLFQRKLPATVGLQLYRFKLPLVKNQVAAAPAIQAVLEPGNKAANFDPFNDTLTVNISNGQGQSRLFVYRPIRSLDEKGMLDQLTKPETGPIVFFSSDDLAGLRCTSNDQVWIETEALTKVNHLRKFLETVPAKVVLYTRPGNDPSQLFPWPKGTWQAFSPAAEIRVFPSASERFPDEIVHLKDLSHSMLMAPASRSELHPLVELVEAGRHGLLAGRISLTAEKRAMVILLPKIWDELFDPQADFATHANISAFIQAIRAMADMDEQTVKVSRPDRIYHRVPFDLEVHLPEVFSQDSAASSRAREMPKLKVQRMGFADEIPIPQSEIADGLKWHGISLERGKYQIFLTQGRTVIWQDTLEVASRAALELANIGFDLGSLEEIAAHSGGRVLTPATGATIPQDHPEVASRLPEFSSAQTKLEKTKTTRLYNSPELFFILLLLLSSVWLLRKKWDLD